MFVNRSTGEGKRGIVVVSMVLGETALVQPIVLSTLNARYIHAAFGLRYLMANMGELSERTCMMEFDINQRPLEIVEKLLALDPVIIGLGAYVWNARQSLEVVRLLKRIAPGVSIVLGGPEVSHETAEQEICALADVVITGEADLAFAELCRGLLAGTPPIDKIVHAELPDLARLGSPYALYDEKDIAHRVLYVEASRGCPFTCEFCLSSLDIPVRQFPLNAFLAEMDRLLARGAVQFKFVDRTFNLHLPTSLAILRFFEERHRPGLFVHFEIVPDRLPEALREIIARFPAGTLQFEAGVQTFNADTAALIERRQNYERLEENLRFLREQTNGHIHADLIAGLPGEDLQSFALGFDRMVTLRPHEIQVGILKRLRGAPIARHTERWGMIYSLEPPYELLCNGLIDFASMQRVRRFAKYWDRLANSGNFVETTALLWAPANGSARSAFWTFVEFTDWAYGILRRTDSVDLLVWAELLHRYLTGTVTGCTGTLGEVLQGGAVERRFSFDSAEVRESLQRDFTRAGRTLPPEFPGGTRTAGSGAVTARRPPKRQQRHLPSEDLTPP